jgi:hypothetical protein
LANHIMVLKRTIDFYQYLDGDKRSSNEIAMGFRVTCWTLVCGLSY